jgi:pimeloyl-ACP methyl ester carboxylesterase
MTERLQAAAGRRFNVATNGRATGTTVVFLHGLLRTWRTFYQLYEGLDDEAGLIAMDLRGHGKSDRAPSYRIMDYAEDVLTLLRLRREKRVVLYGHSLGGLVALAVAALEPGQVEGLILEDPPFSALSRRLRGSSEEAYFAGVRACLGGPREVDKLCACYSEINIGQKPNGAPLQVKDTRDELTRWSVAESLATLDPRVIDPILNNDWLPGYDMQALARQVQCPTLLLQGDVAHGAMVTDAEVNLLSLVLGNKCQVIHFAGAGHDLHGPRAGEILELIRAAIRTEE